MPKPTKTTTFREAISRCITAIEKANIDAHGKVSLPPRERQLYEALVEWMFNHD